MHLKAGARLRSQVDATEVIVVRAPTGEAVVSCGGHPMIDPAAAPGTGLAIAPGSAGTLMGKRYTADETGIELLVTKPGSADLAVDGVVLTLKEAKPLPASD
ncbi:MULTISPECIES: hypothetical protein [Nocardia]|uniref:hypothetical protein n=1 Tax=Nocardia TaxID=1817 RepID=UPI000D689F1E|nr:MULTISPECIES: hypothetical protein [Nocardia]